MTGTVIPLDCDIDRKNLENDYFQTLTLTVVTKRSQTLTLSDRELKGAVISSETVTVIPLPVPSPSAAIITRGWRG